MRKGRPTLKPISTKWRAKCRPTSWEVASLRLFDPTKLRPTLTPSEAEQLTPQQMQEITVAAEKKDPGVLDKVGAFYAQHPELVKVLGGAALAIALGQMATRMRR